MQYIENKTFDEIVVGDSASLSRTLNKQDIELFALASGDVNPAHIDPDYAKTSMFHVVIAHGMWGGALVSAVLGTQLPGPGTIYLNQSLSFRGPVKLGDTVTVSVTVTEKTPEKKRLLLDCLCVNQAGKTVTKGVAEVIAPTEKVRRPRTLLPDVVFEGRGARFKEMLERTRGMQAIRTAVVHPCDEASLTGAMDAYAEDLIVPVLVGPKGKIETAARAAGISLDGVEIVDVPHSHAAAETAVELVSQEKADALMKGALHTDELMSAVLNKQAGLRTERRLSHIYVMDAPHYSKPLLITDAAINIRPDLACKRDIVQNAIDLAIALQINTPKVALLSAVETINASIPSTLDAAALCKMADRGQISGAVLDGPLAFDNAISTEAADIKGIVSPVAGDADILLAPDLEAGNMMAKQLMYLAGADAAGLVLGARVPIILTSRADDALTRLASATLAQLYVNQQRQ
ncbi:bifunctional enoyl-CoA hydratase/phosphate acetyltransferase [Leucothrix pacifica]|uniref:Enoyl-CoA hydratase n=1 Tax=Leucothrix pacifica TaxID=1247513 RepID=A0A317CDJ0_9GAMM|nr:bifunctional enoyl-CoA hydratase/phosphate acetyltransferase [Leucothrix pacifica]PWQ96596.1 enoyl-CoA hydratase [Leucothrix pacifica]